MKKERVFWGVFLIVAAIVLLISKLGYLGDVSIFKFLFSVVLVLMIIKSIKRLNFAGILFPLAFIAIIYDEQLGIEAITAWPILLAALLGTIGLSLIFDKRPKNSKTYVRWDSDNSSTVNVDDAGYIRLETSFSSSIKYINTDKFEGADIDCSFGNMKIYFDNATMAGQSAVVNMDISFGGIQMYIPRSWKIENKAGVSFGTVEEKNKIDSVITNTLILTGDVSFSGVEIYYI